MQGLSFDKNKAEARLLPAESTKSDETKTKNTDVELCVNYFISWRLTCLLLKKKKSNRHPD